MIKKIILTLTIIIFIGIIIFLFHQYSLYSKNKKNMQKYKGNQIKIEKNFDKVLIVYYSFSGNTKSIAEKIQNITGGDLYKVEINQDYNNSPQLYLISKKQINTKNYPELKNSIPDFSLYDLIFIGSPVWWYTVSPPILSFLSKANFLGKKIVPFATHGGNIGNFFEDFRKNVKNAEILKSADFYNVKKENQELLENKIIDWLNKL
ncbi:MAG: flavodoxin [Elusimicrobiota bacterium]|jgi:flavodoxin|nr:flavodoxin [Elusimicrobiota bacterium]